MGRKSSAPPSEITRADGEVLVVEEEGDAFVVAGHWPMLPGVGTHDGRERERQRLHPRVHRHHRAQPRQLHAPHDGQLQPDGAGGPATSSASASGASSAPPAAGPRSLNLWEEDGFDGLATSFRHEFDHSTLQDPKLAKWWAEASNYRRHGDDRVLVPAPWSPTITELVDAGVQGETYAHEQIHVPMGTARDFLEVVAAGGDPGVRGVRLEARAARGRPRWSTSPSASCSGRSPRWEQLGRDRARRAHRQRAAARGGARTYELATGWHRFLVVDAPLSPMRIGRQPVPRRPSRGLGRRMSCSRRQR